MISDHAIKMKFFSTKPILIRKSQTTKKIHMGLINEVDMVCLSPVGYGV